MIDYFTADSQFPIEKLQQANAWIVNPAENDRFDKHVYKIFASLKCFIIQPRMSQWVQVRIGSAARGGWWLPAKETQTSFASRRIPVPKLDGLSNDGGIHWAGTPNACSPYVLIIIRVCGVDCPYELDKGKVFWLRSRIYFYSRIKKSAPICLGCNV